MIETSLFADQEREAKLNRLGDALSTSRRWPPTCTVRRSCPGRERGGRPPFPTELMVRAVDPALFSVSDEQTECQLLDRLSFQRFAGYVPAAR